MLCRTGTGTKIEIFGMEGIPAPDVADYKRRKEIELGLNPGSISAPQAKRPKIENKPIPEDELRNLLEQHKKLMGASRRSVVLQRTDVCVRRWPAGVCAACDAATRHDAPARFPDDATARDGAPGHAALPGFPGPPPRPACSPSRPVRQAQAACPECPRQACSPPECPCPRAVCLPPEWACRPLGSP
ncbi:hypothetical protein B0H14DRAFT_354660 [Mycena olivaceomarginata]|nr:hypothetical protein B0H14DRAFT_354660 [Mycena olivaceomarginata]